MQTGYGQQTYELNIYELIRLLTVKQYTIHSQHMLLCYIYRILLSSRPVCAGAELLPLYADVCHALQLIHMDLKSKNVLLSAKKDLAKIADVGLSRIIQSTLGGQSSNPFSMGTFEYTAPEILLGRCVIVFQCSLQGSCSKTSTLRFCIGMVSHRRHRIKSQHVAFVTVMKRSCYRHLEYTKLHCWPE